MTARKTERIHSLDALRAIMMLLGIILHVALTYNITDHGSEWYLKDPNSTHLFSDFLVLLIHYFRMPVFFFIAGFFGALLFYEKTPQQMLKNRFRRVLLPFIVFLFLLWPCIIFSFEYTSVAFSQQGKPLMAGLEKFNHLQDFLPRRTGHLWFLYYLSYISLFAFVLALLMQKTPTLTRLIKQVFCWVIARPLIRITCFSLLICAILVAFQTSMVEVSLSLAPELKTFTYFLYFYLMGWLLYVSRINLDILLQYAWLCTSLAIVLVTLQGLYVQWLEIPASNDHFAFMFVNSIIISLFIFGLTGLFIRYCSKYSFYMRYISDASYWVYLVHFPLTVLIPAFIWKFPLPAFGKFSLVVLITSIICFASYHYLVRNSVVGQFLNGRRYPQN